MRMLMRLWAAGLRDKKERKMYVGIVGLLGSGLHGGIKLTLGCWALGRWAPRRSKTYVGIVGLWAAGLHEGVKLTLGCWALRGKKSKDLMLGSWASRWKNETKTLGWWALGFNG